MIPRLSPFLILLACAVPGLAQTVRTVDAGGAPGSFADVQTAIDASSAGDLVLVKAGSYPGFVVDGKGVTVAAEIDELATITGSIEVRNVPAGDEMVLSGLRSRAELPVLFALVGALSIESCAGQVLVQDCDVEPANPTQLFLGTFVDVESCAAVTITDSRIAAGPYLGVHPGEADVLVRAVDSTLHLLRTTVSGVTGADGPTVPTMTLPEGGDGGPALELVGGFTSLVGCDLRGGDGGFGGGFGFQFFDGGDGGPAVRLSPGTSAPVVLVRDSALAGGAGGGATVSSPPSPTDPVPGDEGPPDEVQAGTLTEVDGATRGYTLPGVIRDGVPATVTFEGEPFDLLWLAIALDANATLDYLPELLGAVVPGGTPLFLRFQGFLGASGTKSVTLTPTATGLPLVPLFEQVFHLTTSGGLVASNPRAISFTSSTSP